MIQTKLLQEPLFAHCGGGGAMSEGRATPPSALVIVPAVMDKHKMLLHNNSNSAPTRLAHVALAIVWRIFGIFEDQT